MTGSKHLNMLIIYIGVLLAISGCGKEYDVNRNTRYKIRVYMTNDEIVYYTDAYYGGASYYRFSQKGKDVVVPVSKTIIEQTQ